jgi:hypothetical protein
MKKLVVLLLGLLVIFTLVGCKGGDPNLMVVSDGPGPSGYCRGEDPQALLITVMNDGVGSAPQTVTKITFFTGGGAVEISEDTLRLAGGESVDLSVPFPSGCRNPADCAFDIKVDSEGILQESNEGDNIAHGGCVG